MRSEINKHSSFSRAALLILLTYLTISIIYSYERILNVDNSYFFFQIVNNQHFWFPENRYGIFISQLPLLFFSHFSFSLATLIHVYSITFPLEYISIAIICHYYLKVKEAPLAIALCLVTGIAFSFLHPVTETYHALIFSILLYAVLVSARFSGKGTGYYFLVLIAALLALISHPIGAFSVGFVALFTLINKQIKIYPALFVLFLAGSSMILRILLVSQGSYDVQQYDNLFLSLKSLHGFGSLYPVIYLKRCSSSVYLPAILLVIVFTIMALKSRHLNILCFSLLSCVAFAVIGILTFSNGDGDMMMEKTFMPAIFMLILPFCYLYAHKNELGEIALPIIKACGVATTRLRTLESIANQKFATKVIASFSDFNEPALLFNHWNTSIDSYILAKCKVNTSFTLFLIDDKTRFSFDSTSTTLFLGPTWFPYWEKEMIDQTHFPLPEGTYKVYYKTN
jgi:hypothetical protein